MYVVTTYTSALCLPRSIYRIDEQAGVVTLLLIAHRKDIHQAR